MPQSYSPCRKSEGENVLSAEHGKISRDLVAQDLRASPDCSIRSRDWLTRRIRRGRGRRGGISLELLTVALHALPRRKSAGENVLSAEHGEISRDLAAPDL